MLSSFTQMFRGPAPVNRTVHLMLLAAIFGFVIYIATIATTAAFYNDDFPESLAVKVELMPVVFPVHMITGALALLLLPLAYAVRRESLWHRPIGRIAAVDVLISGLTAFPVALISPVTLWSAVGFTAQATTWLLLLSLGIFNICRRRVAAHRARMLLMAATTSGAIFFRVFLGLWAKFGTMQHFETFYALDAWVAWLFPLGICVLLLSATRKSNAG
jgi:Predicted membrane protein (DUF2306)